MKYKYSFFVLFGLAGAACTPGVVAPASAVKAAPARVEQLTIKGRVQASALIVPEGAHVAVYQIHDDGRLAPVSDSMVASDQEGRFTIQVTLHDPTEADLLVRADSVAGYGLAVVPTALSVDGLVPAQPINEETTVEAQVYLAAKSAGVWPSNLHVSRLSDLVSPRLAQTTLRERDFAATVQVLGRASAAAASAWVAVLQAPSVGVQPQQLKSTLAAIDWSQYTLAAGLNSARTAQEADNVRADFQAGIPLAYGLAAIRPHQLVLAAQATASTYEVFARKLSDTAQVQVWIDMELQRAAYVTNVVNEAFYQLGDMAARAQTRALSEALLIRIAHQQGDAQQVQRAIHAAWVDYRAAVFSALQQAASPSNKGAWERAMVALQQRATETNTAMSHLDPVGTPVAVAGQVAEIMGQVMAEVKTQAVVLAGASTAVEQSCTLALLSVIENLDVAAD